MTDKDTGARELWQHGLNAAWKQVPGADVPDLDTELLAAYAEGRLTAEENAACEELLSRDPTALEVVNGLWLHLDDERQVRKGKYHAPAVRRSAVQNFLPAACVLIAVVGVLWGFRASRKSDQFVERVSALESELASTRHELAVSHKERFFASVPSGIAAFWNGTATPAMLRTERGRGSTEIPSEALAQAEATHKVLNELANSSAYAEVALVDSISVEIVSGKFPEADGKLREAERSSPESPSVANARAVWYLAQAADDSLDKGMQLLRELTHKHPDYLPAWYNLALLLEQTLDYEKSRVCWKEYLKRETRPAFARVAEDHLHALPE